MVFIKENNLPSTTYFLGGIIEVIRGKLKKQEYE